MTRHKFLEAFDRRNLVPTTQDKDAQIADTARSEGYEAGYASGWDDAISSDQTSRMRMAAEFERNIQNLAFTFAEAVTHVREELSTFLELVVDKFLPEITPDALRSHVKSELLRMGIEKMDVPVEIVTSPDCNSAIADMLSADFSLDVSLIEDTTLTAGQVFVRLGEREVEIDLDSLVGAVSSQLRAISAEPNPEKDER